jgi:mitochondrial fission protein ELM1
MEDELKRRIGRYLHFHDFNKTKANPFYAYLQLADIIIVTGDSVSMCSESCSTGKPVYIFSPDGNASEKHKAFHNSLYENGYAKEFNEDIIKDLKKSGIPEENEANKPLNSANDIAAEIKKRSNLFI